MDKIKKKRQIKNMRNTYRKEEEMERTRRLRTNAAIRDMVRENHVRIEELIYPIFVIEGKNICHPVDSMP